MKKYNLLAICTLLALLLVPAVVFAQEEAAPERGVIEFGFRGVTGEVYGRTDPGSLPYSNGFRPDLLNSPLNAYSDYRNAFYVPKLDTRIDSLFGSKNYLRVQSSSNGLAFQGGGTLTRDQSVLVTFGNYGHYKAQFRYDQTPHIFSGTTRTLYRSGGRGVWLVDPALQGKIFGTLCGSVQTSGSNAGKCSTSASVSTIANTLNNAVAGSLVAGAPGAQYFTQQENRKALGALVSFDITPDVNVFGSFSRENQVGTRPIGFVMGNGSTGYEVEAPESIDYYTNTLKFATEFGKKNWDGLLGYQGSFFQNNTPSMVVTNPYSTVYDGLYAGATGMGPASGRMDLYPDNRYQQFVAEGAASLGTHIRLMANVTPGFLRQNQTFQPLTTNTAVSLTPPAGYPAFLPRTSLDGKVDTLAMNYTAVLKATKSFKVVAKYQHYKYDDSTEDVLMRPVIADTAFMTSFHGDPGAWHDPTGNTANPIYYVPTEYISFTTRLFDVGGTWFFTKKNSVKVGYQRGWVDRTHREAAESIEDSVYGALDMKLRKTVTMRISGRHQNRVPQEYEFADGDYYSRMVDQAPRVRDRGDVQLGWDATQRLSITGFWGTLQDNFNQRGGVNSTLPLGDASVSPLLVAGTTPTPIYGPYYAYGVLNNIGRNYGVDVTYALTPKLTLFAEYAREKNTGIAVEGRGFDPSSPCTRTSIPVTLRDANGVVYSGAGTAPKNCDPINDLLNASKDVVNNYYGGVDITASKKVDLSLYYSLSAGQSFLFADGVNCQIGSNGPNSYCGTHYANWKLDYLTSSGNTYYAYGMPQAGGFGFPQLVSRTHEVGGIVKFKLTDNLVPKFQYIYRQNDYNDWQTQVNPYSFTGLPYSYAGAATDPAGTSALQKMLWLGADNPSYRAHIFSATVEYHF